jgi:hypothetical protein
MSNYDNELLQTLKFCLQKLLKYVQLKLILRVKLTLFETNFQKNQNSNHASDMILLIDMWDMG